MMGLRMQVPLKGLGERLPRGNKLILEGNPWELCGPA